MAVYTGEVTFSSSTWYETEQDFYAVFLSQLYASVMEIEVAEPSFLMLSTT